MRRLRWGILSTARIAQQKVIPAIQASRHGVVTSIASRDKSRAQAVAKEHGIEASYDSYSALLHSPDIDAVYIPLPNHLHVDWSIRCLTAGKHVLCEKPLGVSAHDAQRLVDATKRFPHLVAAEAFMYRHHPQWSEVRSRIDSGAIGTVKAIQSMFTYFNDDPNNIRNQLGIGGGGLLDIGCYSISLSRYLLCKEPSRVCSVMDRDPQYGTDRVASVLLDFDGAASIFCCATQLHRFQQVQILGTRGRMEVLSPFNSPPDLPTRILCETDAGTEAVEFDAVNQFSLQADAFAQSVFTGQRSIATLEDALANMRAIDAAAKSAASGQWVAP